HKNNIIENLNNEISNLKAEKKMLGLDMDIVKNEQNKIKVELKQLAKEKEELKKEQEKLGKEKEEIDKYKEELLKEKEQIQKNKDQIEKEKEHIQINKDELEKDRERQENNLKKIIIKYGSLQKEVDELTAENSVANVPIDKIKSLDLKLQEIKKELASEKIKNNQLKILYNKLKEKESELVLFQNENLSLKSYKKELNKIRESKKCEMDNIESDLHEVRDSYKKLAKLIIKRKIKERDDLHFEGHPQSLLLKTLWFGYVDLCKTMLKMRDAYLYSGNKNHRFITAYDTGLNETRGIFLINEEDAKHLIYVGPFNKFYGYSVTVGNNKNNLEIAKCRKCSYIFEEIYETKKGTKLVLIKEKESGKYFSGLSKQFYFDKKKKKGVDNSDYNKVVNKLINYITNEKEENGNIIIKTSDQKLKIENEKETCFFVKTAEEDTTANEEKSFQGNDNNSNNNNVTTKKKSKSQTTVMLKKKKKKKKVLPKNGKIKDPKLLTPQGNKKELKVKEMNEENLHKYNIAKDMLLLSDNSSYSTSTTDNDKDDSVKYNLKNKVNTENEKNFRNKNHNNNLLYKSLAMNYMQSTNISLSECIHNDINSNGNNHIKNK
ncbi:autophagy-related protein 23, putative, partial [Plasmodium malariae]